MKTKLKGRGPEILWATVAVLMLITAIHKTVYHGINNSWYFYGFIFLALFMYFIRKKMRENSD